MFSKQSNVLSCKHNRGETQRINKDILLPPKPYTTFTFALKMFFKTKGSTSEPPVVFSYYIPLFFLPGKVPQYFFDFHQLDTVIITGWVFGGISLNLGLSSAFL